MNQNAIKPTQRISVFDIFKIGTGSSSSHTLGPWRATQRCLIELQKAHLFDKIVRIQTLLYGSLAKTGIGHGTDFAVIAGLLGEDPVTSDTATLPQKVQHIKNAKSIKLDKNKEIAFDYQQDIVFLFSENLPFHPNGIRFVIFLEDDSTLEKTYYSVGGGFVVKEGEEETSVSDMDFPYPIDTASQLAHWCKITGKNVSEIVWENEQTLRKSQDIEAGLLTIWQTMKNCIFRGCHTSGELPGGLRVQRRASRMNEKLLPKNTMYQTCEEWFKLIKNQTYTFNQIINQISCFAIAVNEENAAFGRVVTAPTNGAAGVIPAVLAYHLLFNEKAENPKTILKFLLTAGEIGSLFKKGATISAAAGGCQAEIGVSSAMAAGALTECMGGSPEQVQIAAEIAMEHHLGMTCDPIGGLVQIPCIERNSMGAIKAITAAQIALDRESVDVKVSMDSIIKTMWETAQDMHQKYKETSDGGLAIHVSVSIPEC